MRAYERANERLEHYAHVDRVNARQLEAWRDAQAECFRRGEPDKTPPRPELYRPLRWDDLRL